MSIWDNVGIIVRSAREHIRTIESYPLPKKARVVIVSSSEQFEHHQGVYTAKNVSVVMNPGKTLGSAAHACYRAAQEHAFPFFFRLDDDLPSRFFVGMKGPIDDIEYVIRQYYRTQRALGVSLVGSASTSRRDWLQPKMIRSWAGIRGAGMLIRTPSARLTARDFIDPTIRHFDDIYESCSHRWHAQAVGRCQYVGITELRTTGPSQTTVKLLNKTIGDAVKIMLRKWGPKGIITTDGWAFYKHNTEDDFWVTVNWKFKRHPEYRGGSITVPKRDLL